VNEKGFNNTDPPFTALDLFGWFQMILNEGVCIDMPFIVPVFFFL
jgi:hypothetical protein